LGGAIETPCVCSGPKERVEMESTKHADRELSKVGASIGQAPPRYPMRKKTFAEAAARHVPACIEKIAPWQIVGNRLSPAVYFLCRRRLQTIPPFDSMRTLPITMRAIVECH